MSNQELRTRLETICAKLKQRGQAVRFPLPFEVLAEIERLNRAVGQQTEMVERWKNRETNARRKVKAANERREEETTKLRARIVILENQLRDVQNARKMLSDSLENAWNRTTELTDEQRRLIQIGANADAFWEFLNGAKIVTRADVGRP